MKKFINRVCRFFFVKHWDSTRYAFWSIFWLWPMIGFVTTCLGKPGAVELLYSDSLNDSLEYTLGVGGTGAFFFLIFFGICFCKFLCSLPVAKKKAVTE